MKNFKTILCGLALLSFAACTQELDTPDAGQNLIDVTIEAGVESPVSKVVYTDNEGAAPTMAWKASGETFTFALGSGGGNHTMTQVSAPVDGKAKFSGKLPVVLASGGNNGNSVFAFYPSINGSITDHLVDISSQTGGYDEKNTHMYFRHAVGAKNYADFMNNKRAITFKYLVSILKVELDFAGAAGTATNVTFSAADLINSMHFVPNTETWKATNVVKGNPVIFTQDVELTDGKATVYLYMLPGTVTDLAVSAVVNNKTYDAVVKAGATTVVAGKLYEVKSPVQMTTDDADITSLTVLTNSSDYDGMKLEIGKKGEATALTTIDIAGGRAVVPESVELQANDEIWICIPKVAKFFHTLTAAELEGLAINLPDKDNGSTLLAEPTIEGKPYVNDWIVALYMGVDTAEGKPLYWATGNMMAVKTNDGAPTELAFFIATAEMSVAENASGNIYRNLGTTGDGANDRFINDVKGTVTDVFQPADATGLRGILTSSHTSAWASTDREYTGVAGKDICVTKMGGSWRLPSYKGGFKAENGNEFKHLRADANENSNAANGFTYTYTSEGGLVNTLVLPKTGGRTNSASSNRALYMSGSIANNNDQVYLLDSMDYCDKNGTGNCHFFVAVRPVTE